MSPPREAPASSREVPQNRKPALDIARFRADVDEPQSGTIDWLSGARLVREITNLFDAAARTCVEPKLIYQARPPDRVAEFMNSIKMGPSEKGSYIVTAHFPLPRPPDISQLDLFGGGAPAPISVDLWHRQVLLGLGRALGAAKQACQRSQDGGDFGPFSAGVKDGISANLCEALGGLSQAALINLEVSLSFAAPFVPPREVPRRVHFARTELLHIGSAGRHFREVSPVENFELQGFITQVNRPSEELFGKILIEGYIDGRLRKTEVELAGEDYLGAVHALENRSLVPVVCRGDLLRRGRRYALLHAHDFRVLDSGAMEEPEEEVSALLSCMRPDRQEELRL